MNRDREQGLFVDFAQLCMRIQEEEEGRKRFGVILASCAGKDRHSKRRKTPTPKVRVAETSAENQFED